jgi:hypothetical protein
MMREALHFCKFRGNAITGIFRVARSPSKSQIGIVDASVRVRAKSAASKHF